MSRNILSPDWWGSLEQMLDDLPESRCLYKDSGLWSIRDEDNSTELYRQRLDEGFEEFIRRAYEKENIYHDAFDNG